MVQAASALAAILLPPPVPSAARMSPYLQAVTTGGVLVQVESDSTAPVTVEYGLRYSTQGSGGSSGTAASPTLPNISDGFGSLLLQLRTAVHERRASIA